MTGEVKLEALKPCPFCGGTKLNYVPGQFVACMNINCGGQIDMGAPWGGPKEDGVAFIIAAWNARPALSEPKPVPVEGVWQPMATAPRDGSHILVYYVDLVDEYDEDNRLVARAVPTPCMGIASQSEVFGLMDVPYQGRIYQNRRYTHWMPLPASPGARHGG